MTPRIEELIDEGIDLNYQRKYNKDKRRRVNNYKE